MAVITLGLSKQNRDFVDAMVGEKLLNFDTASNSGNYLLGVALGCGDPQPVDKGKSSYVRTEYVNRDFLARAVIYALSIDRAKTSEDVDKFATDEEALNYSEQLAESGFSKLRDMYEEDKARGAAKKLMEKQLEANLEKLYLNNVEDDI